MSVRCPQQESKWWWFRLFSLLYSSHYFSYFLSFFLLLNTYQSCHKTSVIIKHIEFNVRFTLDLCELNLYFFILTKLLPQEYIISQDKIHLLFRSEGMSWVRAIQHGFSLTSPSCRVQGTGQLLQSQPLSCTQDLCLAIRTALRCFWDKTNRPMEDVPKQFASSSLVNQGVWEPLSI